VARCDSALPWSMNKEPFNDDWFDPGEKRQKLRLLADHNIPQALVEEIREHDIAVKAARELGLDKVDDPELLSYADKTE
jgi:hypothetical protein